MELGRSMGHSPTGSCSHLSSCEAVILGMAVWGDAPAKVLAPRRPPSLLHELPFLHRHWVDLKDYFLFYTESGGFGPISCLWSSEPGFLWPGKESWAARLDLEIVQDLGIGEEGVYVLLSLWKLLEKWQ